MATTFNCPACQRLIAAEVEAGTQVQCPICRQIVTVPGLPGSTPPVPWPGPAGGAGPMVPPGGDVMPPSPPGLLPLNYAPVGSRPVSEGLAIGALVCGIIGAASICAFDIAAPVGLVGLILGIVALVKIKQNPTANGGKGKATAGICTGSLSVLMIPVVLAVFVPLVKQGLKQGMRESCQESMHGIGQALHMYANDNNGMFPDASADWQACLNSTGFPIDFECPSFTAPLGSSFFYVPGYGEDSDPRQIVAYENPANHPGEGGHILYRDGSVRWVPWAQFTKEINGIKLPDGKPFDPYARPVTKDEPEDEDE